MAYSVMVVDDSATIRTQATRVLVAAGFDPGVVRGVLQRHGLLEPATA